MQNLFSNIKLVIGAIIVVAFLSLFAAYKIKASELEKARATIAVQNTTIAVQNTTIAAAQQNTQSIKASTKKQQERAIQETEIKERIVLVPVSELSDVEKDLCRIITRLFNTRVLVKDPGGDPAAKGVLPAPGKGTPDGA